MKIINKLWLFFLLQTLPVQAQINPDNTLPTSTTINQQNNIIYIEQGTQKETNLFHSFTQFSVPDGITAYFNNNTNIKNIFSRVTGSEISQINGIIQANGNANLFLMNPQGIVFGKNASLNIGGSFLATTANSMKFADDFEFIALNQQTNPLLTVTVPVGLQFNQPNLGEITVLGNGHNLAYAHPIFSLVQKSSNPGGLKVQKGQSLTLVGGNINLVGGTIEAPEGNITLASIGEGTFNLNNLDITGVSTFKNIEIIEKSSLETIGNGGGNIFIAGNNINVKNGSGIFVQNIGDKKAGNINIKSHQLLVEGLDNTYQIRSFISYENDANGFGGDVNINTDKLFVKNGGFIGNLNFGVNYLGNVNIKANNSIDIIGYNAINPNYFSLISSSTYNQSLAGNVNISSPKINLIDGGTIASATFLNAGNSGNIEINSQDIFLTGFIPVFYQPSSISTATFGKGNAGNLLINTEKITIENQGLVISSTFAQGDAGSININAINSIKIFGDLIPEGNSLISGISSATEIISPQLRALYQVSGSPTGGPSNITINTKLLSLEHYGLINVSNLGDTKAGIVEINADQLILNQSAIAGFTSAQSGGNIILTINDIILLRNQSVITANAIDNANGGNIIINSPFIVALSSENSDIIANAFLGKGGNININALGLFGIDYRDQITDFSDINASSQFGLNGIVNINTPVINSEIASLKLPSTPIDISGLVANQCNNNRNSFTITGRNGLPNDPFQTLGENYLQVDLGNIYDNYQPFKIQANLDKNKSSTPELVEAQKWVINEQNQVVLINDLSSNYNFGLNNSCALMNKNK